jgi:hypothetical protein
MPLVLLTANRLIFSGSRSVGTRDLSSEAMPGNRHRQELKRPPSVNNASESMAPFANKNRPVLTGEKAIRPSLPAFAVLGPSGENASE